jgi:hypothetical protein
MSARVLVCVDRWLDGFRCGSDSPHHAGLVGSLRSWGGAEVRVLHWDVARIEGRSATSVFFDLFREFSPQVVVDFPLRSHPQWCVDREALRGVQGSGAKVVSMLCDISDSGAADWARRTWGWVDCMVLVDNDCALTPELGSLPNALAGWPCQDPGVYLDAVGGERPFDVAFMGTFGPGGLRGECIEALQRSGLRCFIGGGQRTGLLDGVKYRSALGCARVGPVFSWCCDAPKRWHVKSRLFECALSGCLMVDEANPFTERFFASRVEYVPFSGPDDLVQVCRYYSRHDRERQRIARAALRRVRSEWSPAQFWPMVFRRLDCSAA